MKKKLTILSFFFVILYSCTKTPEFSDIPRISFDSYTKKTAFDSQTLSNVDSIQIKIHFEDGNGDLGMKEDEKLADTSTNFLIVEYVKRNGVFVYNTISRSQYPFLAPTDNYNGPLDGTMEYVSIANHAFYFPNDTLKFKIFLKDRAGNQSNTIETSEVIVNQ